MLNRSSDHQQDSPSRKAELQSSEALCINQTDLSILVHLFWCNRNACQDISRTMQQPESHLGPLQPVITSVLQLVPCSGFLLVEKEPGLGNPSTTGSLKKHNDKKKICRSEEISTPHSYSTLAVQMLGTWGQQGLQLDSWSQILILKLHRILDFPSRTWSWG